MRVLSRTFGVARGIRYRASQMTCSEMMARQCSKGHAGRSVGCMYPAAVCQRRLRTGDLKLLLPHQALEA